MCHTLIYYLPFGGKVRLSHCHIVLKSKRKISLDLEPDWFLNKPVSVLLFFLLCFECFRSETRFTEKLKYDIPSTSALHTHTQTHTLVSLVMILPRYFLPSVFPPSAVKSYSLHVPRNYLFHGSSERSVPKNPLAPM